jgi:hypothetical protein
MPGDKPIKRSPGNMLQKIVQNAILVPHGVDPFRVQETRQRLNMSRINAMHPVQQRLCRTAVAQGRA